MVTDKSKKIKSRIILYILIVIVLVAGALSLYTFYINQKITVSMPAFFSQRNIEISMPVTTYLPGSNLMGFRTDYTIDEIKMAILDWDENAKIVSNEESLFISSLNINSQKIDYYYIYRPFPNEPDFYRLTDFWAHYKASDNDINGFYLDFIIPMHLLQNLDHIKPYDFSYGHGEKYKMISNTTIDDVYNFYQNSGYYEVEKRRNKIIISDTYFENNQEPDGFSRNYKLKNPIIIEISESEHETSFSCTVTNSD